jgi:uncharacterized protein involved in outer membrane biogenesis
MPKLLKIILFAVGGLIGLLALAVGAIFLFVDANAYKSQIEAAASEALGMEVHVGGRLGIAFLPGLHVTLKDAHIRNRGAEIASAKEANLAIDLLPLLYKEVLIGEIALKRVAISIERDRDGNFNFEKPDAAARTLPTLDLVKVSLANATLRYADQQSGEGFETGDCSLDMRRVRLAGGKSANFLRNLSFTAQLACAEIRKDDFTVSDLKLSASGKNGVFDLKPVTMLVFGAQGSGNIRADFSGAVPLYDVRYVASPLHIEEFFKTLSPEKVAEGLMDFSAHLTMQGETVSAMTQTADGEFSLRSENLRLHGRDLDRELARFESSQNFNLVDLGAFFYAGPFGLMITKGYSFASIFQGSEGSSEIRALVSDWKVERGVAQAQDVAMATHENRIALKGKLDFVNEQFDDVTVALIDADGCAKVRQKISGPFREPVVAQPSVLKAIAGPVLGLLKKGRDLLGGKCEPFYTGSVTPSK